MGVPRLFPWLVKNCRKAVRHFQEGDFTITVDVLYIDANAILHGSDQTVYNYGSNRRLIDDYAHLTPKQKQTRCFELFFDVIKQISNIVIPTEILDISLDGPAPLSKQAQQRQRRFASAAERGASIAKGGPDSNKMTPGTLFMFELTKFMQYAIRRELNDPNSLWHKNGIKVRFSCPTVPGEGEHKLLNNLRDDKSAYQKSHCFYGPDGDLIMLTLAAHVPKMFLFREDQFSPGFYDLLDMGKVRRDMAYLLHQGPGITSQKRTLDDVSNDFILAGFFVGNDFLPKIQMFMYLEDGLELMIATYASISKGGLQNVLTKHGEINHDGFTRFVEELSRREIHYIADQAVPKADKSGKFLDAKFDNHTLLRNILANGRLDMTGYRHAYYAKMEIDANNENQVRALCKDYIRSIAWVFRYYVSGLPSWRDYYRWHYAPLMSDLLDVMHGLSKKELQEIYRFEMDEPSPPFVQLLSVLPPVSAYLLPVPFQKLLTKSESVLVKAGYYPSSFKIDLEGKTKEHMGVALLPFVDYEVVYAAYNEVLPTLKNKYVRNNIGKPCIFELCKDYTCNYTSDYGNIGVCHVRKIV